MILHYQHKLEALPLNSGIEDKEEEKMRSLKDLLWSMAMAEPKAPERVWWCMHLKTTHARRASRVFRQLGSTGPRMLLVASSVNHPY